MGIRLQAKLFLRRKFKIVLMQFSQPTFDNSTISLSHQEEETTGGHEV